MPKMLLYSVIRAIVKVALIVAILVVVLLFATASDWKYQCLYLIGGIVLIEVYSDVKIFLF